MTIEYFNNGLYLPIIVLGLLVFERLITRAILPAWRSNRWQSIATIFVAIGSALSMLAHAVENAWYWPTRLSPGAYGWMNSTLEAVAAWKTLIVLAIVFTLAATGMHRPRDGESPSLRVWVDLVISVMLAVALWILGAALAPWISQCVWRLSCALT